MGKSELIEMVATRAGITKKAASLAIDAVCGAIETTLSQGENVTITGLGTFSLKERAARTGRNPRTGEPIQIRAAKVPHFKAGKALKEAVGAA